jgi:ribonuclease D
MFPEDISKELVSQLPKAVYNGRIVVVQTVEDLNHWLPLLTNDYILGFDTETKPTFKKGELNGLALLQLANNELALLIKLKEVGMPDLLANVLENPKIYKVGAAIRDDIKSLQKIRKFVPNGFIDLQSIVPQYGINSLSVRKMAGIVLGCKVSKSQQLSNWDAPALSDAQQQYAAIDAWACKQIYQKLIISKLK